jgi:F420H(2)-dependent quinone reductase
VALYEATEGRGGGALGGRTVVVLTTNGAKSGNNSKNPVMRIKSGATHVAVASNGGGQQPCVVPQPLRAPEVLPHDGATVHRLRSREVHGEEKSHWWLAAEREWPHFAEFRIDAGDREIPVMALEPIKH